MRAPLTRDEKKDIVAMATRGIHAMQIANIMRCRKVWIDAVLRDAGDGRCTHKEEPPVRMTRLPHFDENLRFLAMSRNGQRRAPLRLPPLPIAGKGPDADGAHVSV